MSNKILKIMAKMAFYLAIVLVSPFLFMEMLFQIINNFRNSGLDYAYEEFLESLNLK